MIHECVCFQPEEGVLLISVGLYVHKELKSSIMEDQILPQGGAPDLNQ